MRGDERLVLLAWPRSGSSSLWQILREHPELELMPDEPFNEQFTEWSPGNPDYLGRVRDVQTLDEVLGELFGVWRGIKVLTYQLDEEQLRHLVIRDDLRIIFIRRRNLLQIAVSDRIAKQTGVYNRWDVQGGERLERRYDSLRPLDVDDLRSYVRDLTAHLAWVESILSLRSDSHTLRLTYEDLYFASREVQRAQLSALWSFLELAPIDTAHVDYHLSPRTAKLGSHGTYGQLPNAALINAALGADDTGWLLPLLP
jgi:hypothetical protein